MDDETFAAAMKALGDPTRFRIVRLLLERQHCARSLALELGISESAVSQHMSVLRRAGLVTSWRHGRHNHYILDAGALDSLATLLDGWSASAGAARPCHGPDSCTYRLDDGACGCLYQSTDDAPAG